MVYLHGGGWVLYDANAYDRLLRELVAGTGAAIVFVNFSRAPEARYPVAIEECYAATKWIAANAAELQLDASRLALVGDSAGGNLAAAVTLLANSGGGPHISLPGPHLPSDRRELRHRVLPRIRRLTDPHARSHEMVLEPLRARPRHAHRADRLPAPRINRRAAATCRPR